MLCILTTWGWQKFLLKHVQLYYKLKGFIVFVINKLLMTWLVAFFDLHCMNIIFCWLPWIALGKSSSWSMITMYNLHVLQNKQMQENEKNPFSCIWMPFFCVNLGKATQGQGNNTSCTSPRLQSKQPSPAILKNDSNCTCLSYLPILYVPSFSAFGL